MNKFQINLVGKVSACLFFLFFFSKTTIALDYFWVGGSGNWSEHNTHWAKTSGGAIFHDQVPTSMDNVFFDANSGFSAGNNVVTIDQTIIYCMDMDWTGAGANPVLACPASNSIYIYGSLRLIPTMVLNLSSSLHFTAFQTNKTILLAGQALTTTTIFEGIGGEWTFLDAFNGAVNHQYGTIRTNGQTVTTNSWYSSSASSPGPSVDFGNSTVIVPNNGGIQLNYPPGSFANGQSHFMFLNGGSLLGSHDKSFWRVTFSGTNYGGFGYGNVLDKILFENQGSLSSYGTIHEAEFQANGFLSGDATFDLLSLSAGKTYMIDINSTQTIAPGGSLVASGTDCNSFTFLKTQVPGQRARIRKTSGAVNLQYMNLMDIEATGGAAFTATNSVDLGNNSGWTITPPASRDLYWVGGSGQWSNPARWSLMSGGVGGACIPTAFDDVFFDINSGLTAGNLVHANTAFSFCRDMTWSGMSGPVDFSGGQSLFIYGSLELSPQTQWGSMDVFFRATSPGKTIKMASQTLARVFFAGIGGEWTFVDAFASFDLYHQHGTVRTNDQAVTTGSWYVQNDVPRPSVFFGNSTITVPSFTSLNLSYDPAHFSNGQSHFIFLHGGNLVSTTGLDFWNVSFLGLQYGAFYGGDILNKLLFAHDGNLGGMSQIKEAEFQRDGRFSGNASFDLLKLAPGKINVFEFGVTQTINPGGTLIASGSDCSHRTTFKSNGAGFRGFISKSIGSIDLQYISLMDIEAVGGASFTATNSVDLGNNAGWTIAPPFSTALYWVSGQGNWSDPAHWALTSGGPGGACVPTALDDVFFDANSGLSALANVNVDVQLASCRDMIWLSGASGSFLSSLPFFIYGSIELTADMSWQAQDVSFRAITPGKTIRQAGNSFFRPIFEGISGSWAFQDPFKADFFHHAQGHISTNNQPVQIRYAWYTANGSGSSPSIALGTSTVTSIDAGLQMLYAPTAFSNGMSNIVFLNGGGLTAMPGLDFWNVSFLNSTNQAAFANGNVLNKLLFEPHGYLNGNGTIHEAEFGKDGRFSGNTQFDILRLEPGRSYIFDAGTVQTISPLGEFIAQGYGGFPIEIKSNQLGQQATLHKDGAPICLDFLYMTDMKATGTGFSYAGANSDDVNNNDGWIFAACPACFSAPPGSAPLLDPTSVVNVQPGQMATLVLQNLPAGFEAVWFNAAQTTELYASTANLFQPTMPGTAVFFGGFRELSTGCIGQLLQINVCATPAPTGLAAQSFCDLSFPTIADLSATGTGILWYAGSGGGSPLPPGMALVGGAQYFASQTIGGCESLDRLAVVVQLINAPIPTGFCMQSFCASDDPTIASLSPNGPGIFWYNVATGGLALSTSTPLVNGGNYYASQTVGGCESSMRLRVMVGVVTAAPGHVCIGGCSN